MPPTFRIDPLDNARADNILLREAEIARRPSISGEMKRHCIGRSSTRGTRKRRQGPRRARAPRLGVADQSDPGSGCAGCSAAIAAPIAAGRRGQEKRLRLGLLVYGGFGGHGGPARRTTREGPARRDHLTCSSACWNMSWSARANGPLPGRRQPVRFQAEAVRRADDDREVARPAAGGSGLVAHRADGGRGGAALSAAGARCLRRAGAAADARDEAIAGELRLARSRARCRCCAISPRRRPERAGRWRFGVAGRRKSVGGSPSRPARDAGLRLGQP